jgi:hypothetical protein
MHADLTARIGRVFDSKTAPHGSLLLSAPAMPPPPTLQHRISQTLDADVSIEDSLVWDVPTGPGMEPRRDEHLADASGGVAANTLWHGDGDGDADGDDALLSSVRRSHGVTGDRGFGAARPTVPLSSAAVAAVTLAAGTDADAAPRRVAHATVGKMPFKVLAAGFLQDKRRWVVVDTELRVRAVRDCTTLLVGACVDELLWSCRSTMCPR